MKFLTSGKVKDVYEKEDNTLVFKFSNRVSAFDVKFEDEIPLKGETLCSFAKFWFDSLPVKNHFIKKISRTEICVKKMEMIKVECVVRGYLYGSLFSRWQKGEIEIEGNFEKLLAAKLPQPIFDPTTKSAHDEPIDKKKCIERNLVTSVEFEFLRNTSLKIYKKMSDVVSKSGFILADLKLEFGRLDGEIVLGDSIGPDEYRLWKKQDYFPGKTQEAYDKQILRDWLTEQGYQKKFEELRQQGKILKGPKIPSNIIKKMTERYVETYETITGSLL